MVSRSPRPLFWTASCFWTAALAVSALSAATASAQQVPAAGAQPPYRVAESSVANRDRAPVDPLLTPRPGEHPLMPAVRWATEGKKNIQKLQDYSATLVKRERIDGELGEMEYMYIKVRHKPFSVYMYFLGPEKYRGREVIFIDGQNNGKMWAHGTGMQKTMFGTVSIAPDGVVAMRGQRYPLTEIGFLNLIDRLITVAKEDTKYGECEVKFFKGAEINNRKCTCIQVTHPVPRRNFLFHIARIFVDEELNIPIRYEAHDWPAEQGGAPRLMEEYTYVNLKVNSGLTDADFDVNNPNYKFR